LNANSYVAKKQSSGGYIRIKIKRLSAVFLYTADGRRKRTIQIPSASASEVMSSS